MTVTSGECLWHLLMELLCLTLRDLHSRSILVLLCELAKSGDIFYVKNYWCCISWSYWLSTSSSNVIPFSLVHERLICRSCAYVSAICDNWISQGSVATRFGCGGIFNDSFVANFPESPPVKEVWKSVENWQSYRYELVYYFFGTQCNDNDTFVWIVFCRLQPTDANTFSHMFDVNV